MSEEFSNVDRVINAPIPGRVNQAEGSDPDRKDQGFSKALKKKMEEKLEEDGDQNDEVILHDEAENDEYREDRPEASSDDSDLEAEIEENDEEDERADLAAPSKHIDLTA